MVVAAEELEGIVVEVKEEESLNEFKKYCKKSREQFHQVTGVWSGLGSCIIGCFIWVLVCGFVIRMCGCVAVLLLAGILGNRNSRES